MKIRQVVLNLSPIIPLVVIPALVVGLTGSIDIGWSLPHPLNWLSVVLGIMLCLGGVGLMIWTIRLFMEQGKGTLTPLDPTKRLVVAGPYRHVRNPMYSGVFLVLYGEGIMLGSPAILVFATLMVVVSLFYVPLVEERGLEQRFGTDYRTYKAQVPRWVPRLTPWEGGET
jgi:protein-S-isoprenylcysteine O-methyltransferase Ste14